MTNPSGEDPDGALSGLGGIADWGSKTEAQYKAEVYDSVNSAFGGVSSFGLGVLLKTVFDAFVGGFASLFEAITSTVDNNYVKNLAVITDHSNSITELRDAVNTQLLQGKAITIKSNYTYTPPEGIIALDVILIGAGGGGSSAEWNLAASEWGGGGGGGGGEVHATLPASLLPRNSENTAYLPIAITVGASGAGGAYAQVGGGGGNTSFGPYLTAGGGNGGARTTRTYTGADGGIGMIPGGKGGIGFKQEDTDSGFSAVAAVNGGNSISAYSLNGGGGGGGAGAYGGGTGYSNRPGSSGGAGGLSPGGVYNGGAGANGSAPTDVVATGGGGGAGGGNGQSGGHGGYPGGGGGGAGGHSPGTSSSMVGGNGGCGIVHIIERYT